MKKVRRFCYDFRKSLKINDHISSYSAGRATGEFLKISITPFVITTILGLSALFADKEWELILSNARQEFVQITGIKLAFYVVLLLVAISFIFYKLDFLTKTLAWFVRSISNISFTINAVLAGAIGGMIVSDIANPKVSNSLVSIITLYLFIFLLSIIFYLSAKVFSKGIRREIDETLGKYKWVFTLAFGIVLCIIWWFGINDEPWIEVRR